MEALPTVVLYKVKRFDLIVARRFIKSKYISLVNLLADAEVMPEYLTADDVSDELAGWAGRWLGDQPTERARRRSAPGGIAVKRRRSGASERAALDIVVSCTLGSPAALTSGQMREGRERRRLWYRMISPKLRA